MVEHKDMDRDTSGGQGVHPFLSWSDVVDEAARAALGSSVPIGIAVYQSAGDRPGFYGSLGSGDWTFLSESLGGAETGWLSGLDITASVANPTTTVDITAGTIRVQGIEAPVAAGPFTDVTLPSLATEEFSIALVDSAAALSFINRQSTPEERRTHVVLQTIQHVGGVIQEVDSTRRLSEHLAQACADYVTENGPLNQGNRYSAASNDLTVEKSAGLTTDFMLRGAVALDNPNNQPNAAEDPVTFIRVIRDGAGDFTLNPATDVPVGFWDNNAGSLSATPKFVNHRFVFFNGITGLIVGQTTYDTLDEAISAMLTEDPEIPEAIAVVRNVMRTILTVKGDVTDLSSDVDMRFTQTAADEPGGVLTRSRP